MNKLVTLVVSLVINAAFAGETPKPPSVATGNTAAQQQQQQQLSTSEASNSGVSQQITFTSPGQTEITQRVHSTGSQTVRNVPSVSGPPLVSSNDTCMGSSSGSVNVAGFGAGYGTTWTDSNCVMLKNSRELWNMGMRAAALTLMCNDADNREALELTGYECPQTTRSKKTAQSRPANSDVQYTDPIVRARLGLAPLKGN